MGKSLGSSAPGGSLVNVALAVLVVLVLVLCAGVFLLYNQEKGNSNDAKIAKDAYNSLNSTYNELSSKYAALVTANVDLSERYNALDKKYNNVSSNYEALKNQSDSVSVKIGEFLESDPTVAYSYKVSTGNGTNNTTAMLLDVSIYNVGVSNVNNVNVMAIYLPLNSSTPVSNSTVISIIPSLCKRTVEFELFNVSRVQDVRVWLG